MSFDDVARRMQDRDGAGIAGGMPVGAAPDPNQLMLEYARSEKRSAAKRDIAYGAILLIGGIAITSMTYSSVSHSGGTYMVAYGPIIVGIIKLMRGFVRINE